jgi:hypothetical protein
MAGLLLARLLTRPDMGLALVDFLEWQRGALVSSPPSQRVFLLPGVLHCLALLFKIGSRPRLLPHAGAVWQQLEQLAGPEAGGGGGSGAEGFAGNSLARKLGMKLAQRIGLLLLPAAQPNWRYQRQAASLDATLGAGSSSSSSTTAAAAAGGGGGGGDSAGAAEAPQAAVTTQLQQLAVAASPAGAAKQQEAGRDGNDVTQPAPDQILPGAPAAAAGRQQEEGVEEDFELPEEVEGILGLLLSGMGDKDTGVRWAAAKGLGRAAGCLPLELAEEVVDNVVGVFNPRGGSSQGGKVGDGGRNKVRGGWRGGWRYSLGRGLGGGEGLADDLKSRELAGKGGAMLTGNMNQQRACDSKGGTSDLCCIICWSCWATCGHQHGVVCLLTCTPYATHTLPRRV